MAKYYKDYTEEEKLRIVDDMINSNLTYKELMEKHSIGARSYKKLRDEYNIRKIAIRNKKFKVNDDYFEIIDTEEKAYWLGFLYADGCVARKGNYYTIKIDQALYDYEHVLKFKEAINSTYPVKIYNDTESGHARIIVGSKKVYDDLIDKGCYPNKTKELLFPTYEQVPKGLMWSFIRGYFDGNGTINIMSQFNVPQARFQMLGTNAFLNGFCMFLEEYVGKINIHPSRGIFYVQIGGNRKTKIIFDLMYDKSTIYLQRKFDIYDNHFYK